MALANNDYNWRAVAAAAIAENKAVTIDGAGKAAVANATNAVGFCPQAIAAGERAPIIRGGKLAGLTGFSAGARLKVSAGGDLTAAGATTIFAVVTSEDATCAWILSGNLDGGLV